MVTTAGRITAPSRFVSICESRFGGSSSSAFFGSGFFSSGCRMVSGTCGNSRSVVAHWRLDFVGSGGACFFSPFVATGCDGGSCTADITAVVEPSDVWSGLFAAGASGFVSGVATDIAAGLMSSVVTTTGGGAVVCEGTIGSVFSGGSLRVSTTGGGPVVSAAGTTSISSLG